MHTTREQSHQRATWLGMLWLAALSLGYAACGDETDGGGGGGGAGGSGNEAGRAGEGGAAGSSGAGGSGAEAGTGGGTGGNGGDAGAAGAAGHDALAGAAGSNAGASGAGGEAGSPNPPLLIETATLPPARYAIDYAARIIASGGAQQEGYTFEVSSGALPPGLALSTAGVLSGRPLAEGDFVFGVTASDSAHAAAMAQFTLAVGRHRWLAYQYVVAEYDGDEEITTTTVRLADTSKPGFPVIEVPGATSFGFSPGGQWLITGDTLYDAGGPTLGAPVLIAQARVQWSPHSKWLVVKDNDGFAILSPRQPATLVRFEPRSTCSNFRWSDDEARLAYDCEGTVHVFETDAVAAQPVAAGKLLGWVTSELLTLSSTQNKLGYVQFGASATPLKELDLAANTLTLSATAPALRRALFRDSSLNRDELVDFANERVLSSADQVYSPGLSLFAHWQAGGTALDVHSVSDPTGPAIAELAATTITGWSTEDEVLATRASPGDPMRFTWLGSTSQSKVVAGTAGIDSAIFGPRAAWVFLGNSTAFLGQDEPQLVGVDASSNIVTAPSRERIGYFNFVSLCTADLSAAGLGSARCLQGPWLEPFWLAWSSDSTTIATNTHGDFYHPGVEPLGLWVSDAQNLESGTELIHSFSGMTLTIGLGELEFQP